MNRPSAVRAASLSDIRVTIIGSAIDSSAHAENVACSQAIRRAGPTPFPQTSAIGVTASYLVHARDPRERDPVDWTPEFSRRARGIAVYAAIRSLGRAFRKRRRTQDVGRLVRRPGRRGHGHDPASHR